MPTILNLTNGWTISIAEDDINDDGNCFSICSWRTCDDSVHFLDREFFYGGYAKRVFSSAELVEELGMIGRSEGVTQPCPEP